MVEIHRTKREIIDIITSYYAPAQKCQVLITICPSVRPSVRPSVCLFRACLKRRKLVDSSNLVTGVISMTNVTYRDI